MMQSKSENSYFSDQNFLPLTSFSHCLLIWKIWILGVISHQKSCKILQNFRKTTSLKFGSKFREIAISGILATSIVVLRLQIHHSFSINCCKPMRCTNLKLSEMYCKNRHNETQKCQTDISWLECESKEKPRREAWRFSLLTRKAGTLKLKTGKSLAFIGGDPGWKNLTELQSLTQV